MTDSLLPISAAKHTLNASGLEATKSTDRSAVSRLKRVDPADEKAFMRALDRAKAVKAEAGQPTTRRDPVAEKVTIEPEAQAEANPAAQSTSDEVMEKRGEQDAETPELAVSFAQQMVELTTQSRAMAQKRSQTVAQSDERQALPLARSGENRPLASNEHADASSHDSAVAAQDPKSVLKLRGAEAIAYSQDGPAMDAASHAEERPERSLPGALQTRETARATSEVRAPSQPSQQTSQGTPNGAMPQMTNDAVRPVIDLAGAEPLRAIIPVASEITAGARAPIAGGRDAIGADRLPVKAGSMHNQVGQEAYVGETARGGLMGEAESFASTRPLIPELFEAQATDLQAARPAHPSGSTSGTSLFAASMVPQSGSPSMVTASGQPTLQGFVATPLTSSQWGAAMSQQVLRIGLPENGGVQHAELRLDPPDLGPLRVSITLQGEQVSAAFSSAHAAVRHALEAALPQLHQAFSDAGIQLGDTSVGQHQADEPEAKEGLASRDKTDDSLAAVGPAVTPRSQPRARGLIDTFA